MILFIEQCLNGIQLGLLLFLLAAGLTLVFGIMDMINLAHGSLYMMGAYFAVTFIDFTGGFLAGGLLAVAATVLLGVAIEVVALRALYDRDHLDQVLATFGLILFFNELVAVVWGPAGRSIALPPLLNASVEVLPGVHYPAYRLAIIAVGLAVAAALWLLVNKTRAGMLVRAGQSNRVMVQALGIDIKLLFTAVFGAGAGLAALAGLMAAPIVTVSIGMGEKILIVAFVVIVIGGIGSIRGAFVAALLVGFIDTVGRAYLPEVLRLFMSNAAANTAAPSLAAMLVYLLMALILSLRPAGLFPAR
jgi:branched-chain amino acid transport system permease protein